MNRVVKGSLYATVLIPLLTCSLWLFWRFRPYDIMNVNKLQVLTKQVRPGDDLIFAMDYCKDAKFSKLQSQVQYSFIDSVVYNVLGASSGQLESGCKVRDEAIVMPLLPPGKYKLGMTRYYAPNIVRVIPIYAISEEFEVLPPPDIHNQAIQDLVDVNKMLVLKNSQLIEQNKLLLDSVRKK